MITHYDLFAGIGGFSLALEEVFTDDSIKHVFCEWERFPTAVLKQHWPDAEYWGDIAELVADTERPRPPHRLPEQEQRQEGVTGKLGNNDDRGITDGHTDTGRQVHTEGFTIVTGGFPCQPFSHAGRRKGTADDRYQWPNMFAVIRNTKPKWVIAENVRGLVTWNDGLVLETVCADLESEGYEVQPFIIPAVAVGAPHRRDRVWIIAHRDDERTAARYGEVQETHGKIPERHDNAERIYPDWSHPWQEVALATCDDAVDDGLSRLVDGVPVSRAKWRKDSLKAFGNGIVMQVAMQIIKGIYAAERAQ